MCSNDHQYENKYENKQICIRLVFRPKNSPPFFCGNPTLSWIYRLSTWPHGLEGQMTPERGNFLALILQKLFCINVFASLQNKFSN
jgi:hypothetical protein